MSAEKSKIELLIDIYESEPNGDCHFADATRAELAALRADLQAAQERIAWLTSDIGEDGLAAINRLIAACERGDIAQQAAPDLSIARDEILRQARQLDAARNLIIRSGRVINNLKKPDSVYDLTSDLLDWLAANAPQPQEQSA